MLCSLTVAGCADSDTPPPPAVIEGRVVAGPVCPVETDPPDPACAPQPVPSAEITVINLDTGSQTVAITDTQGRFRIEIEAGTVQLTGETVQGLIGVPDPVEITATPGDRHVINLTYDTGIR